MPLSPNEMNINVKSIIEKVEVDDCIPLSYYYRDADYLLGKASIYREERSIINLYITLLKFSSLVIHTIPSHKSYKDIAKRERKVYKKRLLLVLNELDSLKLEFERKVFELNKTREGKYTPIRQGDQGQVVSDVLSTLEGTESKQASSALSIFHPVPSAPPLSDYQTSPAIGAPVNLIGEQVEFRGMGYVPELFIPLLEEVCTRYPSLIESQHRRSRFYAACAFTALGRILHFLDTTKIGHVNGDVCKCLRLLWDEVQSFSFDLSWLAPQVEFALSMKVYMERVGTVQKLEDDVRMLKMKIRKLNKGLVETTKELAYAKGDLVQTSAELGEHVHTEEVLGYRRQIKKSL